MHSRAATPAATKKTSRRRERTNGGLRESATRLGPRNWKTDDGWKSSCSAHQAAGFVGLRSRYGRCGRAVREGEKQPAFRAARSSHPGCLARHAGHRRVVKKAQAFPAARRRSSLGRLRCCVGEGPTRAKTGSNPRDRTGRATAERTSAFAERVTLRGAARNRGPIVAHRIAFARCVGSGAGMKCGRGNRPHHARAGTTEGCAAGSRRGFARRKSREPSLGSAGPRAPFTFG